MASTFRMDPAKVWSGTDFDVALRIAAERQLHRMIEQAKTDGG